jgi:hypothetical protein
MGSVGGRGTACCTTGSAAVAMVVSVDGMCASGLGAAAGGARVVSCMGMGAVTGSAAGVGSGVASGRVGGAAGSLGVSVAVAGKLQDISNNSREVWLSRCCNETAKRHSIDDKP